MINCVKAAQLKPLKVATCLRLIKLEYSYDYRNRVPK